MSEILVSRDGRLTTITLNRPAKRNALTAAMYESLGAALVEAADSGATVVVLQGADGAFTAGNDLADMTANPPLGESPPGVRFLRALTDLPAVLVAAVDGPAVGVGTTMLLHCDLVYATQASTFRLPFVNLGLVPEAASTLLLPRLAGHQRASELVLFGEPFDAAEAHRLGLVREVLPHRAALEARVADRAAALLDQPATAVRAAKALLVDETTATVADRLELDRNRLQELLIQRSSDGPSRKRPA